MWGTLLFLTVASAQLVSGQAPKECFGRKCQKGIDATCGKDQHHKCLCPPGTEGDAMIHCVDSSSFICVIHGDPHVHDFSGAIFKIPLPCRTILAKFHTKPNKEVPDGCDVMVTGDGNFLKHVKNPLISVERVLHIEVKTAKVHFKAGVHDDGFFNSTKTRIPTGTKEKYENLDVTFGSFSGTFQFTIDQCGFSVRFRSKEDYASISAPKDSTFYASVCGKTPGTSLADEAKAAQLTKEQVVMHRFLDGIMPTPGELNKLCAEIKGNYDNCTKKDRVLDGCTMMNEKHVAKCAERDAGSLNGYVQRYSNCIKNACSNGACFAGQTAFGACSQIKAVKEWKTANACSGK